MPQPVRHLRQVPRAGLVPALNLPWVFPLLSLRLEHAAAFELQTTAAYSPRKLSSVYALLALPDQAKQHGGSAELTLLFSSLARSRVIQTSFAVLECYNQTPSQEVTAKTQADTSKVSSAQVVLSLLSGHRYWMWKEQAHRSCRLNLIPTCAKPSGKLRSLQKFRAFMCVCQIHLQCWFCSEIASQKARGPPFCIFS